MNDNQPITLDELLGRIKRARKDLLEMIAGLDEAQLEARHEGGWAISDHLLHLAVWEKGVAEFLRGRPRAASMGLGEEDWQLSMDEVNELIYEQTKGLSADQARQRFDEAHKAMLEALAGMSDEDLMRPHVHFLPHGEEGVATERLVLETIVANTYEHYDEHAQYIRQTLSQGPSEA